MATNITARKGLTETDRAILNDLYRRIYNPKARLCKTVPGYSRHTTPHREVLAFIQADINRLSVPGLLTVLDNWVENRPLRRAVAAVPHLDAAVERSLQRYEWNKMSSESKVLAETDPRRLVILARTADAGQRAGLVRHPDTPLDTLVELALSGHAGAVERVVSDLRTSRSVITQLAQSGSATAADRMATYPDITSAELDNLLARFGLLPAIAAHPNLSMDTLRDRFVERKNHYKAPDSAETRVVKARLPREQMLSLLGKRTTARWVAALVVACPRITADDIVVLAHSTDLGLRAEVASSQRLTPQLEALLASDASPTVRAALAANRAASANTVAALMGDGNAKVSGAASTNPARIGDASEDGERVLVEDLTVSVEALVSMSVAMGNVTLLASREEEAREAVTARYPELAVFASKVTLEVLLALVKADNRF